MIEATVTYKKGGEKTIVAESYEELFAALDKDADKYSSVQARSVPNRAKMER